MYNHQEIEKKWQQYWKDHNTFQTDVWDFSKPKYYILDMFPYPSGQGLHVGHPEGYTATDIIARKKRMEGFNVLHPMGFDSFGLPAEQYAIATGNHPNLFTQKNIDHFRDQIQSLGFSYDWDREIATSNPDYYKWTQWIFLQLYKRGLAYVDEIPVNWCPDLKAVLANEEVIDGKSERGGYPVIRKPMRQWVLRITDYADQLLEDLEKVDWPNSTKEMQRNWIGKSNGANVVFPIDGFDESFTVFTTRPDTLFGATYAVMAPEHALVDLITTDEQRPLVEAYKKEIESKSDLQRTDLNKDKTGVFTGAYAINPVNGKKIPIWISDYVLASYGTGAIMAVPAHDQRDYEFAKKFGLEIIPVLEGGDLEVEAFTEDGVHINSGFLDGMGKEEAIQAMIDWLEKEGAGQAKTSYKLRDWLFSRQRYWGEPIPIVHLENGEMAALDEADLPLVLPDTDQFLPADNGESPLANVEEWVNVEVDGVPGKRETNTMPQWAGSCWYYMRYLDPKNENQLADPKLLEHWLPVDLYVGGAEHAVLHLLYSRFWHKVLHDAGVVNSEEPFAKLFHQGMILGENGEKMSKSKGNVVNPDEIIESHGSDALRVYEMFMGPLESGLPWSGTGLDGTRKWLERVWRYFNDVAEITDENDHKLDKVYHQTVKKVSNDIDTLNFNTAISQMMIFINDAYKSKKIYRPYAEGFVKLLSPFAPHLGEELWQKLGHEGTLAYEPWPEYDENQLVEDLSTIVVQINGKVRDRFETASGTSKEDLEKQAMDREAVQKQIAGKEIKRVIVVPDKLVNIVVGK